MIEIIKMTAISYVGYKSLLMLKKEYADVIAFICVLYIGISICAKLGGWYTSFMDSEFIQLMIKIFG